MSYYFGLNDLLFDLENCQTSGMTFKNDIIIGYPY